jgi:hypothetical protein
MSISTVTMNDPMVNFFRAVETARQRNIAAFDRMQPSTALKAPIKTKAETSGTTSSQNGFYRSAITGVNTAPGASIQSSGLQRTKTLGNYFDAYA